MIYTPSSCMLWQLCEVFDSLFLMQSQWWIKLCPVLFVRKPLAHRWKGSPLLILTMSIMRNRTWAQVLSGTTMRTSIAAAVAGSKRKIALLIFIILSELRHRLHSRCPRNPGNKSFNCITTAGSKTANSKERMRHDTEERTWLTEERSVCAASMRTFNRVSRPPWHAMIKIHLPSFSSFFMCERNTCRGRWTVKPPMVGLCFYSRLIFGWHQVCDAVLNIKHGVLGLRQPLP